MLGVLLDDMIVKQQMNGLLTLSGACDHTATITRIRNHNQPRGYELTYDVGSVRPNLTSWGRERDRGPQLILPENGPRFLTEDGGPDLWRQ